MNQLEIIRIEREEEMQKAWEIRKIVFVQEQNCPEVLEYEFEEESTHYLAYFNQVPVATCRWRTTEKGIKFERFAVLAPYRRKGIADALVKFLLHEVASKQQKIYLHAQVSAMPLYAKNGFIPEGEKFDEAGIEHFRMVKD